MFGGLIDKRQISANGGVPSGFTFTVSGVSEFYAESAGKSN